MCRKAQDLGLGLGVQDDFSEKIKENNQHPRSQGSYVVERTIWDKLYAD